MIYDYAIVGSGLFGSVFAYEATKVGKKVLVRIDGLLIDSTGLEIYLNNQIASGASFDGI